MTPKQIYSILAVIIVGLLVIIGLMAMDKDNDDYNESGSTNNSRVIETPVVSDTQKSETVTKTAEPTSTTADSEWKEYTNDRYGFNMSVPASTSSEVYVNGKNAQIIFTSSLGNFELDIRDMMVAAGPTPEMAPMPFKDYHYFDMARDSEGMLGGQKAAIFKAPRGYCDGPGCSVPYIAYSTNRPVATYYNLVFRGDSELNATEKKILESFTFKPLQ